MANSITTADIQRWSRTKWEYLTVAIGSIDAESLEVHLNAFGADGWMLVGFDGGLFIFKRQTGAMYE